MKKINLFLIFASMLLILAMGASADTEPTCTLVPVTSSINYDTVNFVATITSNGSGAFNVTGVNFTISGAVVGSNLTFGVNKSSYGYSVDTTTLSDTTSSGTTITADIIVNTTKYYGSCTSTSAVIDNTAPVCGCNLDKSQVELHKAIDYTCGTSTDITTISTSCVSTYNDASTETETDTSGDFTDTDNIGQADIVCTLTDQAGHSTTCSTLSTLIVNRGAGEVTTPTGEANRRTTTLVLILVLVVIIVVAYLFFESTKKGKKKGRK